MIVVYRACSKSNPHKKHIISDKGELVQTCFNSFLTAFKNVKHKLFVLLDKPNPALRAIFKGCTTEETYYPTFDEGNIKSFHRQIDIALQHPYEPFLFVEDDYLFTKEAGEYIDQALQEFDFITPYDHPDYYTDIHEYKRETVCLSHHWQTVNATTLTFGGKYKALEEMAPEMKKHGWADYPMWLEVTKKYKLWSPIPSLATHSESNQLSPVILWETYL